MAMEIILMICGVYEIFIALLINTKGFLTSLLFKIIPFFVGVATCLCAMNMFGWVNIF